MIVPALRIAALSFFLLTSPCISPAQGESTKLVAQVGNVPVTIFDVGREQQRLLPLNPNFHGCLPQETLVKMRAEALNTMIEQAYMVNYALDNKLIIDKKIISSRLEDLKRKYKSEIEFRKALGDEDFQEILAAIERTLLAKKAEDTAVLKNINITEANVRAYYESHKQMYNLPRLFKASHILVKVDPSSNSEERITLEKKAKELARKAKSGEDFYNLAFYYSDDRTKYVGGDLGYFHEGQTLPEFEDTLKKMKVNEISEPIKSMYGWHIIKLVELNEAHQLSLDDAKVEIREQLENAAKTKLYNSWMSELKSKYPVKIFKSA